jgi:hypothetical protein
MQPSDAGSHSEADDNVDEGSRTRSHYFGQSTMMVSRIRGMIDSGYFVEGMGRELEQETIPEPNADEAVVFEEFFTAGLRMPPHPELTIQVSSADTSADSQCHLSIVKLYLGGNKLWGRSIR